MFFCSFEEINLSYLIGLIYGYSYLLNLILKIKELINSELK
jgi:hypothetical protein